MKPFAMSLVPLQLHTLSYEKRDVLLMSTITPNICKAISCSRLEITGAAIGYCTTGLQVNGSKIEVLQPSY